MAHEENDNTIKLEVIFLLLWQDQERNVSYM